MMAAKKAKSPYMMYKEKPLIRVDDVVYYGNLEDPYLIMLTLDKKEPLKDLQIATEVGIALVENDGKLKKPKVLRSAKREGLYQALDVGEIWLEDALETL